MGRTVAAALAVVLAACGGGETVGQPSTTGASSVAPAATPKPRPPFHALHLVPADGSSATVKVRERLAANTVENDAVLTTPKVSGELAILIDGSVWGGSKLVVDVAALRGDIALRDRWVEKFGLETAKYPTADLTPTAVKGLPVPLPASGEWSFTIEGMLRVKETSRAVVWQATAKRDGKGRIEGAASTVVTWAEFGITKPTTIPEVVSVDDRIALRIALTSADSAHAGCAPKETAGFDFWVGTWNVAWRGQGGEALRGTNTVTKAGCEIVENFVGPLGKPDYVGLSVSRWMPELGKWQQYYSDNAGFKAYYTGGPEGDAFVLYRSEADGRPMNTGRLVWRKIGTDTMEWDNERTTDGGRTWLSGLAIQYTRAR